MQGAAPGGPPPVLCLYQPAAATEVLVVQKSLGRKLVPYLYLSPALISILILSIGPLAFTLLLSLTNASVYTLRTGIHFIGFENFVEIFSGSFAKIFFPVFGWNILFAFLAPLTQYALGMFIAVLLNNPNLREANFYKSLFIIPWAIPAALAILAWTGLFNTSAGSINLWLTTLFGIEPIRWLQEPWTARIAVLIVGLWLGFPWFMTICGGALQSIPFEVYEAADIDGASSWQKFWRVTFPMMIRFTAPLLIGSIAFNFNNFNGAFLMTGGGPPRLGAFQAGFTDILVSVGYKLSINLNRYALSAALSTVLFLIVIVISVINMQSTGAFKEEEG